MTTLLHLSAGFRIAPLAFAMAPINVGAAISRVNATRLADQSGCLTTMMAQQMRSDFHAYPIRNTAIV